MIFVSISYLLSFHTCPPPEWWWNAVSTKPSAAFGLRLLIFLIFMKWLKTPSGGAKIFWKWKHSSTDSQNTKQSQKNNFTQWSWKECGFDWTCSIDRVRINFPSPLIWLLDGQGRPLVPSRPTSEKHDPKDPKVTTHGSKLSTGFKIQGRFERSYSIYRLAWNMEWNLLNHLNCHLNLLGKLSMLAWQPLMAWCKLWWGI